MRALLGCVVLLLAAASLAAQDDTMRTVDLRVVSSPGPGIAIVDRGRHDKLQVGDRVILRPRQGGTYPGTITRVDERQAILELGDRSLTAPPGTRGEVRLPKSRFEATDPKAPAQPARPAAPAQSPEHPPWKNQDPNYAPGKPLLANTPAVRPEERQLRFRGGIYAIGELTRHPETDFDESFLRVGTDLRLDNPLGDGGTARFNGEINHRAEYDDSDGNNLVVRTLSYGQGGTRFQPFRWEAGRFLQQGMPEFGVLDGGEVSWRFADGNRVGASIGAMPVPDEEFSGTQDKQIAVYGLFPFDPEERLAFGAGFQKTFHSGDSDRDLFVFKGHWLPEDAWQLEATTWIDVYTTSDDIKGSGVELTQVLASATRTWNEDDRLRFAYRRLVLPELLRHEFLPLLPDELRDDHADELSGDVSVRCSETARLHSYLAGWIDEDSMGGAVELGMDWSDLIQEQSLTDITLFANTGEFATVIGARADWVRELDDGRWNVLYEIANHHEQGYPNDMDDLLQQRLRASRTFYQLLGSEVTLHGELRYWDEELAWTLGFFFRRGL